MLLMALVFYLHYEAPPDEQNFPMVMEMIQAGDWYYRQVTVRRRAANMHKTALCKNVYITTMHKYRVCRIM